jgi:Protein of unknown function (DUF4230)
MRLSSILMPRSAGGRSSAIIFRLLQRGKVDYIPVMRQILVTLILAAIFLAGIWLGFRLTHWEKGGGVHEEDTVSVVQQIQTLSELVTVKYVVEKVVILDDEKWYGESRVLLLAHGVVKAGIDLKKLSASDVRVAGKKIFIHLPDPQITDAYLDDRQTRVIDHTTGLLREYDKDLEQSARETAVLDLRMAARQNGILNDADERARLELAVFLHQAGYDQIEFDGQPLLKPEKPVIETVP